MYVLEIGMNVMVFSRHLPRRADEKVIFLHQIHFLDSVWYYITRVHVPGSQIAWDASNQPFDIFTTESQKLIAFRVLNKAPSFISPQHSLFHSHSLHGHWEKGRLETVDLEVKNLETTTRISR